ncbi:hypothetical protein BJ741DRAFT_607777 [Chytriomyces cf. hyalinus JEL632]|nr:hypothetical protein BJ741DRAFT_607777 [Chytriomyces cf. hyalinus JEL632]
MAALSIYSNVCIFMTVVTLAHLVGFVFYLSYYQDRHRCARMSKRRSHFSTSFNINLIAMIAFLLLIYSCETSVYVARDCGTNTEMVENILVTGRTIGFIATEIAYINYSYDRAKGIFEQTLPPAFSGGFYWVVKAVPLLFLPTVLFRIAPLFASSSEEAASIFSMARWYGASTSIVTVLLDIVFLAAFVLFLQANRPMDMVHSVADNSMVIIAQYGAVAGSVYIGVAGAMLAYAEWIEASLRMLGFIQLSVISMILTGLKWKLQKECIRSQAAADARLKNVLGSVELHRIRSRDVLPHVGSPKRGSESVLVVDINGTLSNLEAMKELEIAE